MADNGTFYYHIQGVAEGTSYSIIYQDEGDRDFQPEIDRLLARFEKSLSVYDKDSIISRINHNENVKVDHYFKTVFNKAKEISELTHGTFDISAEPLFKAWGFSSQERNIPDNEKIKQLRQYIGMEKIWLDDDHIIKSDPNIILNANAIAKGYSADLIADFLENKACENFLVEIGGEIRVKGFNTEGQPWRVGIDRPAEDNPIPGQNLEMILQITDKAIATSGNYRQFYIEGGQKVVHTIDPSSGYPVKHNLVSVTVVADECITADAFATAFLVVGIEKSLEWINEFPYLEAIFICNENEEFKVYCTPEIQNHISAAVS